MSDSKPQPPRPAPAPPPPPRPVSPRPPTKAAPTAGTSTPQRPSIPKPPNPRPRPHPGMEVPVSGTRGATALAYPSAGAGSVSRRAERWGGASARRGFTLPQPAEFQIDHSFRSLNGAAECCAWIGTLANGDHCRRLAVEHVSTSP